MSLLGTTRIDRSVVILLASVLLLSCQSTTRRGDGGGVASTARANSSIKPHAYPIRASGSEELVQIGLQHHPGIRAAEAKVRRLRAKIDQVTALPDPKAKISGGSMAETAAGRVDLMAGIEQGVPFPGKLSERGKIAEREAATADANLEAVKLQVAQQIRQFYWSYFLASRTTDITSVSREVLELVRGTIDARVAANQATQGDQLRLATELGDIEKTLIGAKQREGSAKAMLNALLNRPAGAALSRPSNLTVPGSGELRTLLATTEATHPEVDASRTQIEAFRHRLRAAELERYPDFMFGLQHGLVSDSGLAPSVNGRDQIFASIGVNIHLWQKPRRAKIREAAEGIEEAESRLAAVRANLRFRVEDAWLRAQSSRDLISLFEEQIIPESKQAFDVSLQSYAAEKLTFVDVLDTWRKWLGFQLQQAHNHTSLGKAAADLRSASGDL